MTCVLRIFLSAKTNLIKITSKTLKDGLQVIHPGTEFGWSYYYQNIYYANAIINKKNEITEGSEAEINQLVGEAYFMRGYMHFLLVNLYGQPYTKEGAPTSKAIPLKLSLDLEEMPTRNTVEEIYASILSCMKARQLIQP